MPTCKHCGEDKSYHHTGSLACRHDMTKTFDPYRDIRPIPEEAVRTKYTDMVSDGGLDPRNRQVGGDHYKKLKIQPIEYIMANKLGYCEGNIVKYISRWRDKGGVEDLRKIKQYVDFLIEQETK